MHYPALNELMSGDPLGEDAVWRQTKLPNTQAGHDDAEKFRLGQYSGSVDVVDYLGATVSVVAENVQSITYLKD